MQIETSEAESPLAGMPISALKVCAPCFDGWGDVPTAAAFIGDEGEAGYGMEVLNEG